MTRFALGGAAGTLLLTTALAGFATAQEIKVWTLNFSSEANNNALASIAKEFEDANPGVDIVYTQRAVDEHKTALRVAAGSDSGPDIYFMWAGLGLGGEFVKAGLSEPLDSYYATYGWSDSLVPTAAAFADDYEGGLHGVPYTFKGEVVYYRKDLFEKAWIEGEPQTYDELKAAAEKLAAAGIPAFTFGGTANWHVMRLMDVLLETACGAEKHDQLIGMSLNWSETPCAVEAFTEMKWWTENHFLKPFMGIDQAQSFNLFVAGRAAMMLEGSWLVQGLSEVSELDNYGIFPFPTGTGRLYGFAEYHYISTKSQNKDLAAEFLDYFNSKDVQQAYLGTFTTNSVNANVEYTDQRPLDAEWGEIFAGFDQMFVNGDQGFPLAVTTEYFRVINEVASGGLEPQAAADELQKFIDSQK